MVSRLTPRQAEVAQLAASGLCNKSIGNALGISEGTVKIHLVAIYDRLGIHSRTMLAARWRDLNQGK